MFSSKSSQMSVFEERGNRSTRRKPLGAEYRTNKLIPDITPSLGIEPGPHWWEASALTTAPPLKALKRYLSLKFVLSWLHCRILPILVLLSVDNLACFNEIHQNVNDLVFVEKSTSANLFFDLELTKVFYGF